MSTNTCINTNGIEHWIFSDDSTASLPLCSGLQVTDLIQLDEQLTIQCQGGSCVLVRDIHGNQSIAVATSVTTLLIGVALGVIAMYFWTRRQQQVSKRRVSSVPAATRNKPNNSRPEAPASVSHIHLSDDSFLPFDEESSRLPIPSNWDDGATMEGFSISGIDHMQQSERSIPAPSERDGDMHAKSLPIVVQRTVQAPPGKLGLALNVMPDGPTVRLIKRGSPMEGYMFVGDVILQINEYQTQHMSTSEIYKVLEETKGVQRTMKIQSIDDVNKM